MRVFIAILLTLGLANTIQAATEVINLGFRSAEEILPVAESLLKQEGSVKAYGNQLIVSASAAKISELREIINQLDSAPKRLLISLDSGQNSSGHEQGYAVDGSIRLGNSQLEIGQGQDHGQNKARIIQRSTSNRGAAIQQIQATEGYPALIQIGQSVPLTQYQYDAYGRPLRSTQYQNVTQGFYATARIIGDQVQVEISSHNNQLNPQHAGAINIQNSSTRVSGKVGEWLNIGQIEQASDQQNSGIARRHSTSGRDNFSARVKVEVLD